MLQKLMNRLVVGILIVLAAGCLFFFMSNLVLKQALSQIKDSRESELRTVLQQERKAILRDVEEKHKADMVSFEALAKRMEIERQRNKQLQEQLAK